MKFSKAKIENCVMEGMVENEKHGGCKEMK